MLEIGTKAPEFKLDDSNGNQTALSEFKGKWIVLYFYPRDNTPGCTREACDFTDAIDDFAKINAAIIGISPDKLSSHQKFIANYNLKVNLLCDPEKQVIKEYQAWGQKNMYGKISEGLIRSTYIIDPEGRIADSWTKVKVRIKRKSGEVKHADVVRERLEKLQAGY